jgi:hypothetical protein
MRASGSLRHHPRHTSRQSPDGVVGLPVRPPLLVVAEPLESRRLLAAIASGQTIAASIATRTEVDSYTFTATAGGTALVTVADTSGNALYPLVQLYAPNGTRLSFGSDQVGTSVGHYALPATGTYRVTVQDYYAATAGNYNITAARLGGAQVTGGDGGAIASGQTRSGTITAGDLDVFTFTGTAGGTALVTAADTSGSALYPLLELFGPNGARLSFNSDQVGVAVGNYALPSTGTYYAVIRDYYADTPGSYNITLASLGGAQQTGTDGGAIASGQTRAATIGAGDLDVFTFSGTAGGTALVSAADTSGTALYPLLELFGPNGARLSFNSDQVGVAVGNYALPSTGTYYAVIRDYYADTPGNYNITLASLGGAQQTGGDAGPIASGVTKSAALTAGDMDVFTFPGTAGGTALVAAADTSGNALYPLLELFGPTGVRLSFNSDQVGAAAAHYNLPATGTYYAVVRDYYGDTPGNYNFTAVSMPGTQNAGGDAGWLASGVTRNARITVGDRDVHTFYAVTGDRLVLALNETGGNTAFYPLVELFNPLGQRISFASNATTTTTTIASAPRTGVYYYVVSDYYADTPAPYSLKLTQTPSATKPTVSIAATRNATEGVTAPGTFVITRTNLRALPVTVNFTITGTARNGTDYTTIPATAVIPPNTASVTVNVRPVNDTTDEPNETVTLTLASSSAYTRSSTAQAATLQLIDNDPAPATSFPRPRSALSLWRRFADEDDDLLAVL